MIEIKCTGSGSVKLSELKRYQGELKKRMPSDINAMTDSLKREGLLAPFIVWRKDDKAYLLDGHGRFECLIKLALDDPELLDMKFPCVEVQAETDDDAKKALLQIASRYGTVNQKYIPILTSKISEYRAPIIKHVVPKERTHHVSTSEHMILRLKVPRDNASQLIELLRQVEGVVVL